MKIGTQNFAYQSSMTRTSREDHPIRDAFAHIGSEVSKEAIVGIAFAGLVCVGDSLGHPAIGRAAVAGLGAARGLYKYRETATAALNSKVLGTGVALAVGAGTAMAAGYTGNVVAGAAFGAFIGLVQAPKSYQGQS